MIARASTNPVSKLSSGDARTLVLAALGGALEFYDFVIFVFFTTVIGQLFFPPEMPDWVRQLQAYGIFAAGYLARPAGGVVMAHFGDLIGRKRMFTLSVFMMAVPTLAIGLLPTYAAIGYAAPLLLLLMRVMQGAAIGGEVPGAWVFVAEHVPANRIGTACGLLTGGLTGGILLGSLAATAINTHYTQAEVHDFAWRIPFIVGGVFGLLVVYLRRYLEETPVFQEISRLKQLSKGLPLGDVLREHRPAAILSAVITWLLTAAVVVIILMTPSLMSKLHRIPITRMLEANCVATLTLTLACFLAGRLVDRFGPALIMTLGASGLAISSVALYLGVAARPDLLIPLYGTAGFFVGVIAVVPIMMVRSFPPQVRFSGISFSYNVSYAVFGGLTPMLVPLMTQAEPLSPALYVAFAAIAGTAVALAWRRLYAR